MRTDCTTCDGKGYHEYPSYSTTTGAAVWRHSVCDECGGDGEVDVVCECDLCGNDFQPIDDFHRTCWGCLADEMNPRTHTQKGR